MTGARRSLALLLAAFLLTACGLSGESPVQPGLEIQGRGDLPISVVPQGPVKGATQEQTVTGFLRAALASDQELDVARSFLTERAGRQWSAGSTGLTVFSGPGELTLSRLGEDRLRLTAPRAATVDAAGRYTASPKGQTASADVQLAKTDGGWRISALPKDFGLWISAADFERLYAPLTVHYVSVRERVLIPDVRWFPLGPSLSTRLARAQLDGVPAYLAGAARTDVPVGSRLTVDAVPVTDGTAVVDLTAPALSTDEAVQQSLWAQFLATLTQVPGVRRVSLRLEGAQVELQGGRQPASVEDLGFVAASSEPETAPVLRQGLELREVTAGRVVQERDLSRPARTTGGFPQIPRGWRHLALSRSGRELAATGGDGREISRWRGATRISVPRFATELSGTSYDHQDILWVGGVGPGGQIWTVNTSVDPSDTAKSAPRALDVPWLRGRRVVALRVAPDGQRIAVASTTLAGAGPRLDVAGIHRQPNGIPEGLADPLRLAPRITAIRDLVWVEPALIAVLARDDVIDSFHPALVGLSGRVEDLSIRTEGETTVPGPVTLTTTGGRRGLVLVTDSSVYLRAGSRWLLMSRGTDLVVPGV
ncbi:GerMN domain-containing protein [Actinomycetota bacterium]